MPPAAPVVSSRGRVRRISRLPACFAMDDSRYKWAALGVVMIGTFMAVLDTSIVNVALPHMMSSFGVNVDEIRWIITLYMVTFAIVTLATNHLRHVFGLKRLYLAGLTVFTLGSLLCGLAWDQTSMNVFRIVQALGGGVIFPAAMLVISECFPPRERGAAFGTFGIVIVFAPTLGPTLGGYLVDTLSWRFIFTINIPVGILALIAAEMILRPGERTPDREFDWGGFCGLALAIVGTLLALTDGQKEGWTSDYTLGCLAAAAAGLGLFVLVGRKSRHPVVDLSLFANPSFVAICLINAGRAAALFGRIFLLPIFMQSLVGYSAIATGWLLAPGALVSGLTSPWFGRLSDQRGPRPFILGGFALMGLSMYLYKDLSLSSSLSFIFWPQLLFGLGMGMMNAPLTSTAMNVVRRDQLGMVSGLLSVIMQVGGAFGVALLGTALERREAFHRAVFTEGLTADAPGMGAASAGLERIFSWGEGGTAELVRGKAQAVIAGIVGRQAAEAAFDDCFLLLAAVCLCGVLLGLTLRLHRDGR